VNVQEARLDGGGLVGWWGGGESWLGEFGQGDRWRFCLTAARMAREQERR
jgi:hypothetical protein